jgi:xylulokinase
MALGARNLEEGQVYNSQGSSSWIAVTSKNPLLDENSRPFVFTHVIPGLFNSAIGVFSTGSTYRWVRDHLCQDLVKKAKERGESVYLFMDQEASRSPAGANGLIFHPNLAGGSAVDPGPALRGALLNLDLRHTRADILRAVIEGIAMQQRIALDILKDLASLGSEMIMVGGGSRSPLWRQIHADVYEMRILKSSIDQEAAALGAAGLAAVGAGEWPDFTPIRKIHRIEQRVEPNDENSRMYRRILPIYRSASYFLTDLGERVREL